MMCSLRTLGVHGSRHGGMRRRHEGKGEGTGGKTGTLETPPCLPCPGPLPIALPCNHHHAAMPPSHGIVFHSMMVLSHEPYIIINKKTSMNRLNSLIPDNVCAGLLLAPDPDDGSGVSFPREPSAF